MSRIVCACKQTTAWMRVEFAWMEQGRRQYRAPAAVRRLRSKSPQMSPRIWLQRDLRITRLSITEAMGGSYTLVIGRVITLLATGRDMPLPLAARIDLTLVTEMARPRMIWILMTLTEMQLIASRDFWGSEIWIDSPVCIDEDFGPPFVCLWQRGQERR